MLQFSPVAWQSLARDRLRSCGASWLTPNCLAYSFTMCQTTGSVTALPQQVPARQTHRNNLPSEIPAALTQTSIVAFTHSGIGTVRMWPPLPMRSTIAQ